MRDPIPGRISGVLGRAFTMIELMVVIMIIALLVSILLPSVNAVRVHAKVAQCKTLLYTLESGLNMFKTDERLGKQYPPSWHSASNGQDDPYDLGHPYQAWGAQTMVWAVVGADLNGPPVPGFDSDKGLRELYSYTDDDPPQPNHERRGPFADPSSLEIVKPDDAKCAIPWADFARARHPGRVRHAGAVLLKDSAQCRLAPHDLPADGQQAVLGRRRVSGAREEPAGFQRLD